MCALKKKQKKKEQRIKKLIEWAGAKPCLVMVWVKKNFPKSA